jgi:dTDP-4-amino-4,6-dideoxygalactose transaminase
MPSLMRIAENQGFKVLEDCAQAFGAMIGGKPVGTFGHTGAFSCFPTKPLGAYGDGGFISTDDDQVAELARVLRVHGARVRYCHEYVGYNSRLDELQAAILRIKLPHDDTWTRMRRAVAERYAAGLPHDRTKVLLPTEATGTYHVYHQYTIRILRAARESVLARLVEAGIPARVFYRHLIPDLPPYRGFSAPVPRARLASAEVVSLPIHPFLRPEQCDLISGLLERLLSE